MKKILIAEPLRSYIEKEKSFLKREDIIVYRAATTDDLLKIHRSEKANLIISQVGMPGMSAEQLCAQIRNDEALRQVSLLMISPDMSSDRERASRCKPNAVMTLPINTAQLLERVRLLLDIPWRGSFRVLLSVAVEGDDKGNAFFCGSENISSSGLLIETDRVISKNDRVTCKFFLPGSEQIVVRGEVVRIMKRDSGKSANQYGIRFLDIDQKARTSIASFVNERVKQT
ncbi:MAG: response regulator [Nitrospirae bacterium]|nr:response regulator [Nitrospirota bacterium]NTW65121.1 response regulator [Nitrospirota bacterium]